jgi:hypothetical protein
VQRGHQTLRFASRVPTEKERSCSEDRSVVDKRVLSIKSGTLVSLGSRFELPIRNHTRELWIEVDISSRNIHNSLWAICATLNVQQGLDNNVFGVLFKGWTSISFRALVFLISDCGSIAQIKTRLLHGAYGWINADTVHMRDILNPFYTEVFEYGRVPSGQHNVPYISRSLWTYLNLPRTPPIGATAAAIEQPDTRRQMRAFMNTGFNRSRNADEALRKS